MPAPFVLPLLMSGISALGGAFGGRKQTQQQTSSTTQNSNSTTNPLYDEKTGIVRDELLNMLLSRIQDTPNVTQSLTRQGISNVNSTFDKNATTLANNATSRGLGRTSAGFAPVAQNEIGRSSAVADVLNQAPLQEEAMLQDRINQLLSFFSSLPVGQQQTGSSTSNTQGTNIAPANIAGSAIQSGSSVAAYLLGQRYGAKG